MVKNIVIKLALLFSFCMPGSLFAHSIHANTIIKLDAYQLHAYLVAVGVLMILACLFTFSWMWANKRN